MHKWCGGVVPVGGVWREINGRWQWKRPSFEVYWWKAQPARTSSGMLLSKQTVSLFFHSHCTHTKCQSCRSVREIKASRPLISSVGHFVLYLLLSKQSNSGSWGDWCHSKRGTPAAQDLESGCSSPKGSCWKQWLNGCWRYHFCNSGLLPFFSDSTIYICTREKKKLKQRFTADHYWQPWCNNDLLFPDSAPHKHQAHI